MKIKFKSRKKAIIAGIVLMFFSVIFTTSIAYFRSDYKTTNKLIGETDTILLKRVIDVDDGWLPGDTKSVDLAIKNNNTSPIAVRAKVSEVWTDKNGATNTLNNKLANNEDVVVKSLNDNWQLIGNYYYYDIAINPNEETSSIFDDLTFNIGANVSMSCTTSGDEEECEATGGYAGATYELSVEFEIIDYEVATSVWGLNPFTLYNYMKAKAVSDTESSTYVSNSNGIEFNHISSNTNGKGIYKYSNGVYYYRGDVSDNNVLFDNKCWQIIRTVAGGTVKMIYNGTPVNGTCPTHRGNAANFSRQYFNPSSTSYDDVKYRTSTLKTYIEGTFLPTLSASAQAKLATTTFYLEADTLTPATGSFTGIISHTFAPGDRIWGFSNTNGAWGNAANSQVEAMTKSKLYIDRGSDTYDALVGLIQSDEVILAGGRGYGGSNNGANSTYYLYSGVRYWMISPGPLASDEIDVISVHSDGSIIVWFPDDNGGVRPVVSLAAGTVITGGNGTTATPFTV